MSVDQFYLLLFAVSLFGGLTFVLLVEVCKLRSMANGLVEALSDHRNGISELWRSVEYLGSDVNKEARKIEDLRAITSVHWELFAKAAERLKLVESSHFFLVRKPPEGVGEPGENHPFAADAFVTIPPETCGLSPDVCKAA